MRLRWIAGVVLVAASMALAACGGDDDSSGGGLSLEELNEETATICRDSNKRIAGVEQPDDITQADQAEAFFGELLEVNRQGLQELRALEPEEDLRPKYDRFVGALADQTEFLEGVVEKAKARDPSGLQDVQEQIETPTLQRNIKEAARDLGLDRCARELD